MSTQPLAHLTPTQPEYATSHALVTTNVIGELHECLTSPYCAVRTIREYVVVSESEPHVEVVRRQDGGRWLPLDFVGLDAACRFESIGCSIPLANIYENVIFEPGPEPRK